MQSSMRKRSATEPSPSSPSLTGTSIISAAGAAATAVLHGGRETATAAMNIPHALPHPPPPSQDPYTGRTLPSPSTSAPPAPPPPIKKDSKMKIFSKPSRPTVEKALKPPPSPNKHGHIPPPMARLGSGVGVGSRGLDESRRPSFSSMASGLTGNTLVNSIDGGSFSTGIGIYSESPPAMLVERGFKEAKEEKKEKDHHSHKPHFLRNRNKDHGTFSSSASNSKIAPDGGSLYSFGPSSPSSTVFSSTKDLQKSISGIDITNSKASKGFKGGSFSEESFLDPVNPSGAAAENAWSVLQSRVLPLFDGDPLRNTVEDLNKLVTLHIRKCVDRRSPFMLLDDVRKLLDTGMASIEPNLADLPDERLISRLVETWNLVFGYTTPYLEAVFLPLQQEFRGCGAILSARESREFFGLDAASLSSGPMGLDMRRLVMISMRDAVVLPIYDRLRVLFSRLQMDFSVNHEEGMEVVGRMLQCVSVLAAAGTGDKAQAMVEELGTRLKWNWLSRGRTGRNRMGFVGTKMKVGC